MTVNFRSAQDYLRFVNRNRLVDHINKQDYEFFKTLRPLTPSDLINWYYEIEPLDVSMEDFLAVNPTKEEKERHEWSLKTFLKEKKEYLLEQELIKELA